MAKARRSNSPKKPEKQLETVLDFVRYAVTRFVQGKVEFGQGTYDAVEDATMLVADTLSLPVNGLEPFLPARLTAGERKRLLALIDRRVTQRIPTAYLTNRAHLQGLSFHVDKRVIIPRSFIAELLRGPLFDGETPMLDPSHVTRVLELCTGSGCLAIVAAHVFPNARIDAVDISADALKVATINVEEHGLEDRIALLKGDLFRPVTRERYDLIITNPPYVDAEGMSSLPREFRHEPKLALAAGNDGLDIVRTIIAEAADHLTGNGGLLCELGRCRPALEAEMPDNEFLWLDTETSSGEVFWATAEQLGR